MYFNFFCFLRMEDSYKDGAKILLPTCKDKSETAQHGGAQTTFPPAYGVGENNTYMPSNFPFVAFPAEFPRTNVDSLSRSNIKEDRTTVKVRCKNLCTPSGVTMIINTVSINVVLYQFFRKVARLKCGPNLRLFLYRNSFLESYKHFC